MGIKHMKDLSPGRFHQIEKRPRDFKITEKLDGSAFCVYFYAGGWYTGRTSQAEFYGPDHEEPWGTEIWKSSFRNAHKFLTMLFDGVDASTAQVKLRCEILSSRYPNALTYHDYDSYHNTLVFYDLPDNLDDSIKVRLRDITLTFPVIERTVGEDLSVSERWVLERWTTKVSRELSIHDELISAMSNSPFPSQQAAKALEYVKTLRSDYGDTPVEGVVLSHRNLDWDTKLVDASWFLPQTARNYELRKKLFRTPRRASESIGDQHARSLNTMSLQEANGVALLKTLLLYNEYLDDKTRFDLPAHAQARNLESLLSALEQYGWQGF